MKPAVITGTLGLRSGLGSGVCRKSAESRLSSPFWLGPHTSRTSGADSRRSEQALSSSTSNGKPSSQVAEVSRTADCASAPWQATTTTGGSRDSPLPPQPLPKDQQRELKEHGAISGSSSSTGGGGGGGDGPAKASDDSKSEVAKGRTSMWKSFLAGEPVFPRWALCFADLEGAHSRWLRRRLLCHRR